MYSPASLVRVASFDWSRQILCSQRVIRSLLHSSANMRGVEVTACSTDDNMLPSKVAGGSIQLIIGPMFSGKSTEMLRRVRRYNFAKDRCIIIKASFDNRFADRNADPAYISTHDSVNESPAIVVDSLMDAKLHLNDVDVLGIDEGQFFPDLIEFCDLAADSGKVVVVSALDGDFRRQPFGSVCDLICKSESVTKLTAVCHYCGKDAPFTERLMSNISNELNAEKQILVGGDNIYKPVCRYHHMYKMCV